ncbi:hypothetical protein KEM54_003179 [Ascosphaera aggregata]|nr:hypothetical protein KEM54_003179 [Ascosphaera aggregata]
MEKSDRSDDHTGITHPILPNPPSVEAAYRQKCIMLKRRLKQVEATNEDLRLRNLRGRRYIEKMRLESCILLERLSALMGMKEEVIPSLEAGDKTRPVVSPVRDEKERQSPQARRSALSPSAERDTEQSHQQREQPRYREEDDDESRNRNRLPSRRASKRSLNDQIMTDADASTAEPSTTTAADQSQPPLPPYQFAGRRKSIQCQKNDEILIHSQQHGPEDARNLPTLILGGRHRSRDCGEDLDLDRAPDYGVGHKPMRELDLKQGLNNTDNRDYEHDEIQSHHSPEAHVTNPSTVANHYGNDDAGVPRRSHMSADGSYSLSEPLGAPEISAAISQPSPSSRYVSAFEDFTSIYRAQVERQLLEEYGEARDEDTDEILKRHWESLNPEDKRQFGDRRYDSK